MKHSTVCSRLSTLFLACALLCTLSLPASALFHSKKSEGLYILDFSKNGMIGTSIPFFPEDFVCNDQDTGVLAGITILSLPDPNTGVLTIGGQPVQVGSTIDYSALSGLRFEGLLAPSATKTSFTFSSNGPLFATKHKTIVSLYLLDQKNHPPIAKNMELSTYKNVAITEFFDATDHEGDTLTFRLTSTPTRGSVTVSEDGSNQFIYTPYENKTGRDSFTFVAEDSAGNVSPEAKVSITIKKPNTKVTYADLEGNSAHKAAIHLAEEGIYVGAYANGHYFFSPDQPVTRAQFLTMAMAVSGSKPLDDVTLTGFQDDASIPTWAKGSVSAALKAGAIRGSRDENGSPVFCANQNITRGEATVMLNNLLNISDVPTEVFTPACHTHWAAQAAANLSASGIVRLESIGEVSLAQPITMAEAAELFDGALDVLAGRKTSWFSW